jgi:prevent-host-death family protein
LRSPTAAGAADRRVLGGIPRHSWSKWQTDSHDPPTGTYSVADAKNRLSDLIDRALKGEGVAITRHGRPIVELKPVVEPTRAVSSADLDWLAAHRVGRKAAS